MFTNETKAIKRAAAKLTKTANKKIAHIIAFGSRVRGDFSEESDMDILVTVHKKAPWIVSLITDLFYREEIKTGIPFSVTILSLESFNRNKKYKTGFYQNIIKDGIFFYGINSRR